jgi:transcriptional regulator with XRE-family HTH domain
MAPKEGSDSMRMWGALHKLYRTAAGLSYEDVAKYVGYSASLVMSIERGVRMPSETYIPKADELLKAGGVLVRAAEHLSRERYPVWFADYVVEEQRACSLRNYSTHLLHGLLQTEAYTRALLSAYSPALEEEEINNRTDARGARHRLFARKPACTCSFVIEESVLRRPWAEPASMKAQLQRLLELDDQRNVSIQVMPTSYGMHAGVDGPMTLLETPEHKWLGYLEAQGHGQLMDDADAVSVLQETYSMIRSQALNPRESVKFIEQLAGEL